MLREKLYAVASCSMNICSVSPSSLWAGSLSSICRCCMFHSTSCKPYMDFISSKLWNICAMSKACETSLMSMRVPNSRGSFAMCSKAFFTRSSCANGLGIAVLGFSACPPFGSFIALMSSSLYCPVSGNQSSPLLFLLYDSTLSMSYTIELYFLSMILSVALSSKSISLNITLALL